MSLTVHTKLSTAGIDTPLQKMQNKIASVIESNWGSSLTGNVYGRIYRNGKNGDFIPEAYKSGKEYTEAYLNDTVDVTSFFYVESNVPYSAKQYMATVNNIFMLKLDNIYSSLAHRADEECRVDMQMIYEDEPWGFRMQSIVTDIDSVFSGLKIPKITDDMQPFHVFKIVSELRYSVKSTSCR